MPDPVLYLQAMVVAAGASAIFVLVLGRVRLPVTAARIDAARIDAARIDVARINAASVLGMGLGLAAGYRLMRLIPAWPPTNGLGRLLLIVLPAVIGIELAVGAPRVPRWLAWSGRMFLAVTTGRILLHDSAYLTGPKSEWTGWQAGLTLAVCGALVALDWVLLVRLGERSAGISLPLALAQATLCAGICVMLAGYVTGGAAALPFVSALVAASIAVQRFPDHPAVLGIIGVGVIGLFGLLFIGHFFGGLSTASALAILLAPLLSWTTELPMFGQLSPQRRSAFRLVLVAVPLIVVLVVAKRDFDREMAPLLGIVAVRCPL